MIIEKSAIYSSYSRWNWVWMNNLWIIRVNLVDFNFQKLSKLDYFFPQTGVLARSKTRFGIKKRVWGKFRKKMKMHFRLKFQKKNRSSLFCLYIFILLDQICKFTKFPICTNAFFTPTSSFKTNLSENWGIGQP